MAEGWEGASLCVVHESWANQVAAAFRFVSTQWAYGRRGAGKCGASGACGRGACQASCLFAFASRATQDSRNYIMHITAHWSGVQLGQGATQMTSREAQSTSVLHKDSRGRRGAKPIQKLKSSRTAFIYCYHSAFYHVELLPSADTCCTVVGESFYLPRSFCECFTKLRGKRNVLYAFCCPTERRAFKSSANTSCNTIFFLSSFN